MTTMKATKSSGNVFLDLGFSPHRAKLLAANANRICWIERGMRKAALNCSDLAERLREGGFNGESEISVKAKLKRGTFPAKWFLAALAVLGMEEVKLKDT